jgi:hypothetical protein
VTTNLGELRRGMAKFSAVAVCIIVVLTMTIGCSRSPYDLAPVNGRVTIDGKPLSQAKVMFAPVEIGDNPNPGKPAFGLLRDDGSFVLTTYDQDDGAVVGEHWVSIVRLSKKPQSTKLVNHLSDNEPQFNRMTLPQKVKVVADQDNQIDLKLTSQDVTRYGVVVRD